MKAPGASPTAYGGKASRRTSPARSAWTASPQENRPVGHGLIRLFGCSQFQKFLTPILQSSTRCADLHESHRALRDGSLGWRCSRHFVPGYDRAVPPGLRTRRPQSIPPPGISLGGRHPNLPPFQGEAFFWIFPGLKPWAEFLSPFGAGPLGRMNSPDL